MESKRVKARVRGRVQGVYFRASTRQRAQELGLTGWVCNTADGCVELEAQGAPDRVDALIDWCWLGPPAARVAEVETSPLQPTSGEAGFDIRR